jgi:hypothetical protein
LTTIGIHLWIFRVKEEVVEETGGDKEISLEEFVAAPPNHTSTSICTQSMLTPTASYEPPPTLIPELMHLWLMNTLEVIALPVVEELIPAATTCPLHQTRTADWNTVTRMNEQSTIPSCKAQHHEEIDYLLPPTFQMEFKTFQSLL